MDPSLPLLIVALGAVFGGGLLGWSFQRASRSPALGAGIGAVAGAFGAGLFMAPLNFCT
ncbi:MAG: hypothetical protein JNL42_17215, partial [Anaerolineae bacterium]|nr:hypothetical protein [Anaerolineae bacterium]